MDVYSQSFLICLGVDPFEIFRLLKVVEQMLHQEVFQTTYFLKGFGSNLDQVCVARKANHNSTIMFTYAYSQK